MNFLGHLALAWPDQGLMVGGFLGDFVKGPLKGELPEQIEQGIRLHRRIDARSDSHSAVTALKSQTPTAWTRHLGIVTDLYCDHLLSREDKTLLQEPIDRFSTHCYQILGEYRPLFPEQAKRVFDHMQKGRWLEQYGDLEFTLQSLNRIGTRLKFANPLKDSATLIGQHSHLFDLHCSNLYAGMQKVVAEWRIEENARQDTHIVSNSTPHSRN